jgi:hypothetical protein
MLGFFSAQQCVLLLLLLRMNIIIILNYLTTTIYFDLYRTFYVIPTLHFLTFNTLTNKMQ